MKTYVIISVILLLAVFLLGMFVGNRRTLRTIGKKYLKVYCRANMFERLYRQTNEWFCQEQQGHTLAIFLEQRHYSRIAVYGLGDTANRIYDSLKNTPVEVIFGIDKNKSFYCDTEILTLDDEFPSVDLIIVTDFDSYETLRQKLEEKGNHLVMSLEQIIFHELGEMEV